jgi:hypothetical protein
VRGAAVTGKENLGKENLNLLAIIHQINHR